MPRKTVKVAYFNLLLPCEKNGKALEKARKSPDKISYHSSSLHPLTEKQDEDEDTCQKVSLLEGLGQGLVMNSSLTIISDSKIFTAHVSHHCSSLSSKTGHQDRNWLKSRGQ